jgi:hypothetical protein
VAAFPLLLFHRSGHVLVDHPALPLRGAGDQHLLDDAFERVGVGIDRAGQRIAAQRPEAHHALLHHLVGLELQAVVVDHDQRAVALHDRPPLGEVERHDRDVLLEDVLPDVELGPVRQREDADRFALGDLRVEDLPHLGALVLRVPAVLGVAEGEDALLGPALFLVAACAAEGSVEAVPVERLAQPDRLHHVGVHVRAVAQRADAVAHALFVDVDEKLEPQLGGHRVAEGDHLAELPGRVDMQEWKGRAGRMERLHRQVQHDGGVLADGIEHHRLGEGGGHLAENMDRFGFEPLQVGQAGGHSTFLGNSIGPGRKSRRHRTRPRCNAAGKGSSQIRPALGRF